jgi:hypothetical protein
MKDHLKPTVGKPKSLPQPPSGSQLIELTCYDTGQPVYISPSVIKAIVPLEAYHDDILGSENSERTRIDYGIRDLVLVKESPAEIMSKIQQG